MVSFILDAFLIIICFFVIAVSIKRGFVKTILSLLSSIAAILLSIVFTPTVAGFIYDKFMLRSLTSGIMSTIKSLAGTGSSESLAEMLETMPEALSDIITRYNVSDATVSSLIESAVNGNADARSVSEAIASPIASSISTVIGFVFCFVVSLVVLKIVIAIVDGIFKFPVLNSVNKLAGVLLGIALAVVIIFVYTEAAVHLITSLGAVSPELFGEKVIDDTVIVKFFSEHNIFGIINSVIQKGIHQYN